MFDVGMIVLMAAHLLGVNLASGGPLLCLVLIRHARQTTESQRTLRVVADVAFWSVGALLIAIVLGVLVGFLRWASGDTTYLEVIPLFGKKVFWGVLEIICSILWMLGYWIWLVWRPPQGRLARAVHATLAILSATNLLYHFPPLMTIMSQVAAGEIALSESVDAAKFRGLVFTPAVIAPTLHVWWASLAVSSGFVFWRVRAMDQSQRILQSAGRVGLAATLLQIPTGIWLLVVTPAASQSRLMGSHAVATACFMGSLISTFLLLQQLAMLAFGNGDSRVARSATWLMAATVLMMTGALHFLRG